MSVLGYSRVSTSEQAENGYGLEAQERAIREECERRGWVLTDVVRDEGESGADLDRPGIKQALDRIAAGEMDGLAVAKLDRLSRSVIDFARLLDWFTNEAEATLVVLDLGIDTSTPGGRLVANVFASVAEWERHAIGQRTRDGLAAARKQGKRISRPAVVDQPRLARRIRRLRAGGATLQQIADRLNRSNVPTIRGGAEWRPSSVQSVLGLRRQRRTRHLTALPKRVRRG